MHIRYIHILVPKYIAITIEAKFMLMWIKYLVDHDFVNPYGFILNGDLIHLDKYSM